MSVHRGTDTKTGTEGFADRWSRRKQEARHEPDAEPLHEETPMVAGTADPEPVLTDADMPPLESLDERSDYAGFLSPGVSEQLRAQALRKLFQLPGLHLPDGLDDYDDDFTKFTALGDTITHEMRRMLARELASGDNPAEVQPGDDGDVSATAAACSEDGAQELAEAPEQAAVTAAEDTSKTERKTEGQS